MLNQVLLRLKEPVPASEIKWRVGNTNKNKYDAAKKNNKPLPTPRGMALAYVDARFVQDRLDWACGPMNWSAHSEVTDKGFMVTISIKNPETNEWVYKQDVAEFTDFEKFKGGFSDAFKRAAVHWGVCRELYTFDAKWVELDGYWNIPKETKEKLTASVAKPKWLTHPLREKLNERLENTTLEKVLESLSLDTNLMLNVEMAKILIDYSNEVLSDREALAAMLTEVLNDPTIK